MRINIINPSAIPDQHLMAEIREIKMLPKTLMKSLRSKTGVNPKRISKTYILNTGHGYFFYNKIPYIEKRFEMLIQEGLKRGIAMQEDTMLLYDRDVDYSILKHEKVLAMMIHDYEPTPEEQEVNLERILLRIREKFDAGKPAYYYRYHKIVPSWKDWVEHFDEYITYEKEKYANTCTRNAG